MKRREEPESSPLVGEEAIVFGGAHVVVANPPYKVVKDKALKAAYRKRYASASRQFLLSEPFTERFFQLAVPGGYIAALVANAFQKREHGRGLIEKVLPCFDMTHVIDTSGVPMVGHGTPTCLLLARNQPPVLDTVRVVSGKRGEPSKNALMRPQGDPLFKPLERAAKALSADLQREAPALPKSALARTAAAWIVGAVAVQALEARRIGVDRKAEHLRDTFARVWSTIDEAGWYADDCDAWWPKATPSRAASDALRATIDALPAPGFPDPLGRSGWATTDTDFIGDVYQALNAWAVDGLALAQTLPPVREFMLDRTLEPAIEAFGLERLRVLDPTCGSGHFLMDTFWRLYQRWADPPDGPPECTYVEAARRALDSVLGADLNAEIVELARYRLFLAYCDAAQVRNAESVFALPIHVVAADSLLAGEVKPSPPVVAAEARKPIPATVKPAQLGLLWEAAE